LPKHIKNKSKPELIHQMPTLKKYFDNKAGRLSSRYFYKIQSVFDDLTEKTPMASFIQIA